MDREFALVKRLFDCFPWSEGFGFVFALVREFSISAPKFPFMLESMSRTGYLVIGLPSVTGSASVQS
jgi:hypothetical protein